MKSYRITRNIGAGLLLFFVSFLFLTFLSQLPVHSSISQTNSAAGSFDERPYFGMRKRVLPKNIENIFEPVFVRESPGNEATVVRLPSGRMKIFYINRPGNADRLMSISSSDNGITWGEPMEEFALPGEAYYANYVLIDKGGEFHCVFHIFARGDNGYGGRHLDLWYCNTSSQGKKWNKPKKIYDGYVGAIRGFIQLENSRLLLVFARAVPAREQKPGPGEVDYGWNETIAMYTDDLGETWFESENSINIEVPDFVTRYGAVEPCIVELKDGRIWMLVRTTTGRLVESFSGNYGAAWSPARSTDFVSSDSPATFLRLSDGRIVLIWSSNQRWDDSRSYAAGGRELLHAAISTDEGETWMGYREVLVSSEGHFVIKGDIGTAYPAAVETAEGKVLLVSGQGKDRAIVIFDPNWLEETTAYDDFSGGLTQWTLFGADNTITLASAAAGRKEPALLVRKADVTRDRDVEAVWNFPVSSKGELVMKITRNRGSQGIFLALTDHYSVSYDTKASSNSVVSFVIEEGNIGKEAKNMELTVTWDGCLGKASIYSGENLLQVSDFHRESLYGLNYLRLGIPGSDPDSAGYYLESVSLKTPCEFGTY